MKYILVILFLFTGIVQAQENGAALKKVVIDPGHGGHDPGAVAAGARTKEKDIVLDIALRLGKMINENYPDVEVIYTRKTDVFVELHRRAAIANNAKANLFISIHANAAKGTCPAGTETIVMGTRDNAANLEILKRENDVILLEDDYSVHYESFDPNRPESFIIWENYQHAFFEQSINFAGEIQNQFKNTAKRVDRGVKQMSLHVLRQTAMPSVLVEVGFICNNNEEKYMTSEEGKQQLTYSIFRAFSSYKAKIDERSSYHSIDPTTEKPPEKEPEIDQSKSTNKVEFCIQISTSSRAIEPNPSNFKRYTGVERFQSSQNLYKYVVGRTANYAAAQENLKKVRKDFKDAFIVCIVDGKIVQLADGLLLNK